LQRRLDWWRAVTQLVTALEMASILSLVTLATMMTFRLAGFPDLSVDGVFSFGAVVLARLFVSGIPLPYCFVLAAIAGAVAGFFTVQISQRLKIHPILASVLMLTMLYSINVRTLGRATQPLFDLTAKLVGFEFVLLLIPVLVLLVAYRFFSTEIGSALRSTGTSGTFLTSVGRNVGLYRTVIVMAAGACVALSGALVASQYGFADVSMGVGTVIIGIAAMIIGEKLVGRFPFGQQIIAVPIGILVYQFAVGIALAAGLQPVDVKLATGVLAVILLAMQHSKGDDLFAVGERT
jgi:putative tryptophan/tyrosine transport system permease protein